MSPRAAWRLESMGFKRVFDYVAGKSDWSARGLPIEGEFAQVPKAADVAEEVPTCGLDEPIEVVKGRLDQAGERGCIVVSDQNVVLGRLRAKAFPANGPRRVEEAMEDGPSTFRADVPLAQLLDRMRPQKVQSVIVTDPDGRLIGVLERQRAEEFLARSAK